MYNNLDALEVFKEQIKKYNCELKNNEIVHASGQTFNFNFEPKFDIFANTTDNKFAFQEYLFKTLEEQVKKQFGD